MGSCLCKCDQKGLHLPPWEEAAAREHWVVRQVVVAARKSRDKSGK